MKLQDLISLASFPAVVSGQGVAALRENPASNAAHDFLSGYLNFDLPSQHALHATLSSLSQTRNGGAFWLSGVFGSGKSHLLGVLSLLGEGENGHGAHQIFAESHPDCARYLGFEPRLTLHISLDEFDASKLGLEAIFWRELEREWTRRGFQSLQIERSGSHIEDFAALQSALERQNLGGLVVCFDELSLFLAAREHGPLQGDAAYLQFLGAHTSRAPLWIFCALQKTIDDISGLENYSLSQVRDRFTLLPLSLANLSALVQKRLIRVLDDLQLETVVAQTFEKLQTALPRLDFGIEEWRASFPFHPATLRLLEAVTGRFFSRTRSAALFCTRAVDLGREAETRIAPDAIWDYFWGELEAHPDLRPLQTVFRAWDENLDSIFDAKDQKSGRRVLKMLLLCKIAGQSPTPIQVANALDLGRDLAGDGAYDYARFLLERARSRGGYLALERGESPLASRYTVDLGRRLSEMARRQISATLETLPAGDARIAAHAQSCCHDDALPLGGLSAPRSFDVFWNHAPRRLSVEVWDGLAPQTLANRAAQTREYGAPDDATLAIWPPFSSRDFDAPSLFALLPDSARAALWLWKPRLPARDELETAREAAAAHLAARDASLADNRRGRALLEHLQKEAPAQDAQVARIALRLLLEGEILLGSGAVLEASELARGDNFSALLEAVGDFGWPQIFSKFVEIAPRARLLTASNADSLCLEILRRPASEPFFAPSMERLARHIGEPLGVSKTSAGRWKIAAGRSEICAEIRDFLGDGATYAALEAHFAKSKWGLKSEQTAVVTCALLRSGEIAAFDTKNEELRPETIGLPLRRAVHFLRPGRQLTSEEWTKIALLTRDLCGIAVGAPSFGEASRVARAFAQWRETLAQSADLARARAAQLRRALNQPAESWPQLEAASQKIGALLDAIPARGAAFETLSRVASLSSADFRDELAFFRRIEAALEAQTAPLLSLGALLNHADLVVPPDLSAARAEVLERLSAGENSLFDLDLFAQGAAFAQNYALQSGEWHRAQNEAARWNGWKRLAQSDAARALERLEGLQNRRFGGDFRAQIEIELGKRCPRESALAPGEAVCSSCGLRLGERLVVRDAREMDAALQAEIETLHRLLGENSDRGLRHFLLRHNSPLLDWDGAASTLLPLLSGAQLRVLDEAFAPRRRVSRSGAALLLSLQLCGTRAEIETAFTEWLDNHENLNPHDEIEISD
ncbi:hypothetical protein B1R32_12016 [Abditibacterium utsteinense]|uniref:DUF6079 domain-containing protein n=1 Tax=Abditibacterium utsteinense TaxID=1960156 RepID=A0A2S8SPW5_9BACT|nr:DUF6079 family protein [Abditibacterium utsteinense]PQV62843.1 hypothetical protein B1R32_12016 [Abditibacterium utsteinense]